MRHTSLKKTPYISITQFRTLLFPLFVTRSSRNPNRGTRPVEFVFMACMRVGSPLKNQGRANSNTEKCSSAVCLVAFSSACASL